MWKLSLIVLGASAWLFFPGAPCGWSQSAEATFVPPKKPVSISTLPPYDTQPVPMPLAERLRRGLVPRRGICSIGTMGGTFLSGDGKMMLDVAGNPLAEQVIFHQESLLVPWKRPFEAPRIGYVLPEVRKLMLAGKYREGLEKALWAATDAGMPPGTRNHMVVTPFSMRIDIPAAGRPKDHLRTLDFESGEIKVVWTDDRGEWVRRTFVSRPDDVAVQYLTAPQGRTLDAAISIQTGGPGPAAGGAAPVRYERDFNERRLIVVGHFSPDTGNIGFAGVTRIVSNGGKVRIENGKLVVSGVQFLMLLTRIERYQDYDRSQVDALARALDEITPDYHRLLEQNRRVQSAVMDRVSMDFGGAAQRGMSTEELLVDQYTRRGLSPALLEQLFDMGRYWPYAQGTGEFPSLVGQMNINYNLQIAPAPMADLPEVMDTYTRWLEGLLPDSRKNAENIFGARGVVFSIHPDEQQGVLAHWTFTSPHLYWISAGGWAYSPVWDYYLVTGDREFLRRHLVPALKELALFYEDFLTETDENGNYIFVPSYSPENTPRNADNTPAVINAVMDISVCKEVLTHLIQASETLGTDAGSVPKWKAMLAKMPPYLLDRDGALKEWAWPSLQENLDHRHVSHLYGVWPSDEVDPDRSPQLARAYWLANRKHAEQNSAGHGLAHRGLAGARLKDDYMVNFELKQFLEQGYIGPTLRTSHNPYQGPMPDEQGAIPTLLMEMLVYSRPGVIEVLPALPESLTRGSVKGMLARTFARVDEMKWDMTRRTVELTLTSLRPQDITLIVRHGIESAAAPPGVLAAQPKPGATRCELHLPQGKPVSLRLHLGPHRPSDWVRAVAANSGSGQ